MYSHHVHIHSKSPIANRHTACTRFDFGVIIGKYRLFCSESIFSAFLAISSLWKYCWSCIGCLTGLQSDNLLVHLPLCLTRTAEVHILYFCCFYSFHRLSQSTRLQQELLLKCSEPTKDVDFWEISTHFWTFWLGWSWRWKWRCSRQN